MIKSGFKKMFLLFIWMGILTSGYASDLNTVIARSGFYEIKAVPNSNIADKSFTLTAGSRKTYTSVLTNDIIPLGFLSAGSVVEMKTVAPATLSLVQKEVKTVKYAKKEVKAGKTLLHTVEKVGFYGLANATLSGKKTGNELDVRILVRKQSPILRQQVQPGTAISLDTEIGWLQPGDVIEMEIVGNIDAASTALVYDLIFLEHTDIQHQIEQAVSRKEAIVYVYPGRYYVKPDRRAGIYLKDLSNFTVHAYNVEMILRKPSQRILEIQGCTDVAVKGFVSDNDPLLFPQGTIVSVAENGAWIDMELHEGYPVPTAKNSDRSMVHDSKTHYRKKNARDFVLTGVEKRDTATYRLFTGQNKPGHGWETGDYISLTNPGTSYSCFINESTRFQLIDVTLYSCAKHWSVYEKFSSECLYRNVTMKPGPRPLLASMERLRSTHSDGIHSKYANIGPRIEDCYFEGLGDDAVAIHGGFGVVLGDAEGDVVELGAQDDFFRPGDRIRFYTVSGDMIYRKVVSTLPIEKDPDQIQKLIKNHYPNLKFVRLYQHAYSVRLDSSMAVSEGGLVANLDRNGKGFSVCNNEVKIGRARGLLIKASDGIVEGNRISHLALPGIVLAAEANDFMEADVISNVVVRNNIIESVNEGMLNPDRQIQAGGLVIVFFGKKITGHHNILIEDNRFINIPGVNIQISHAADVRVNRNAFIGSHHRKSIAGQNVGVDNSALIWMDYVNDVTFGEGKNANLYQEIGKYADKANLIRY